MEKLWNYTKIMAAIVGYLRLIWCILTNMTHLGTLVNLNRHQWYTRRYGSIQVRISSMTDVRSPGEWLLNTSLIFQSKVSILGQFTLVVSYLSCSLLRSIKCKFGIQTLAMHILKLRQLIKFSLLKVLSLVIQKALLSLFPKYNTVFGILDFFGINSFLIIS